MKGNCDRTLGTPGAWCPAHHVPAVSAELAEAQLSAMEQPQLSVKSCLGDLSCVGIFFFFCCFCLYYQVLPPQLLSLTATLLPQTFAVALLEGEAGSVTCGSGTDPHHSSRSFPFRFSLLPSAAPGYPSVSLVFLILFSTSLLLRSVFWLSLSLGHTVLFFSSSGRTVTTPFAGSAQVSFLSAL